MDGYLVVRVLYVDDGGMAGAAAGGLGLPILAIRYLLKAQVVYRALDFFPCGRGRGYGSLQADCLKLQFGNSYSFSHFLVLFGGRHKYPVFLIRS